MQNLWQNYRLYYRIKEEYELIRMDKHLQYHKSLRMHIIKQSS